MFRFYSKCVVKPVSDFPADSFGFIFNNNDISS